MLFEKELIISLVAEIFRLTLVGLTTSVKVGRVSEA